MANGLWNANRNMFICNAVGRLDLAYLLKSVASNSEQHTLRAHMQILLGIKVEA